jgi:hypothetical protein
MSGAQPRRSCTVCAFMVASPSVEIDAWNSRTISLPPSGRAVLGTDLNCSESRWAPPTLLRPDPMRETAALRTSTRLLSGVGHSRPMRPQPPEHVCPLLPESGQTGRRLGTSALCQNWTHAPQQRASLFDYFVSLGKQCRRDRQAKRFRRSHIDRHLKLCGLLHG